MKYAKLQISEIRLKLCGSQQKQEIQIICLFQKFMKNIILNKHKHKKGKKENKRESFNFFK